MAVRMVHPDLEDAVYDAQPGQVPHLQESGWQVVPGQDEQGEVWPVEAQRFEGQQRITMRHPDLDSEIVVAESAVPYHRERGWHVVEDQGDATSAHAKPPRRRRASQQDPETPAATAEPTSKEGEE